MKRENFLSLLLLIAHFVPATLFLSQTSFSFTALASTTNGTIDSSNKYAKWLDASLGVINFGTAQGNVHVTASSITGYAWGEVVGWINLSPASGGVVNNGASALSGYAWGELTGWINFAPTQGGVTIKSSGDFSGYAWSEN